MNLQELRELEMKERKKKKEESMKWPSMSPELRKAALYQREKMKMAGGYKPSYHITRLKEEAFVCLFSMGSNSLNPLLVELQ